MRKHTDNTADKINARKASLQPTERKETRSNPLNPSKKTRKKRFLRLALVLLICLVITEVITRKLGYTDQPLFREDKNFEFIPLPNQNVRVYGHKFVTNEFSMRSEPIDPADTNTVLLLGDSIIFGSFKYDNDSLASSILQQMLTTNFKTRIPVLNVSAPAWSPDNDLAYVKKYGTFHAKQIILVVNSVDGVERMTFPPNFGKMGGYGGLKKKNYYFGIESLIEKMVIKTKAFLSTAKEPPMPHKAKELNPGFAGLDSICKNQGIPFTVYLHSMNDETGNKKYSEGGEEIIKFCTARNIPLIKGIDNEDKSIYEDANHFSYAGQKFLANQLYQVVVKNLANKLAKHRAG